jgi:OmpR-family two-component system manganese-sensing response regulator
MQQNNAKILVVDDDELTIDLLRYVLGLNGHQITPALTVAEGIQLASAGGFDVFVLDNLLPDGTGHEMCSQIRTFDSFTPIIFCSGDATLNARQMALAAGAQLYLVKPVDTDELEGFVLSYLKGGNQAGYQGDGDGQGTRD